MEGEKSFTEFMKEYRANNKKIMAMIIKRFGLDPSEYEDESEEHESVIEETEKSMENAEPKTELRTVEKAQVLKSTKSSSKIAPEPERILESSPSIIGSAMMKKLLPKIDGEVPARSLKQTAQQKRISSLKPCVFRFRGRKMKIKRLREKQTSHKDGGATELKPATTGKSQDRRTDVNVQGRLARSQYMLRGRVWSIQTLGPLSQQQWWNVKQSQLQKLTNKKLGMDIHRRENLHCGFGSDCDTRPIVNCSHRVRLRVDRGIVIGSGSSVRPSPNRAGGATNGPRSKIKSEPLDSILFHQIASLSSLGKPFHAPYHTRSQPSQMVDFKIFQVHVQSKPRFFLHHIDSTLYQVGFASESSNTPQQSGPSTSFTQPNCTWSQFVALLIPFGSCLTQHTSFDDSDCNSAKDNQEIGTRSHVQEQKLCSENHGAVRGCWEQSTKQEKLMTEVEGHVAEGFCNGNFRDSISGYRLHVEGWNLWHLSQAAIGGCYLELIRSAHILSDSVSERESWDEEANLLSPISHMAMAAVHHQYQAQQLATERLLVDNSLKHKEDLGENEKHQEATVIPDYELDQDGDRQGSSSTPKPSLIDMDIDFYGKSKAEIPKTKLMVGFVEFKDASKVEPVAMFCNLVIELMGLQHDSRSCSHDTFVCLLSRQHIIAYVIVDILYNDVKGRKGKEDLLADSDICGVKMPKPLEVLFSCSTLMQQLNHLGQNLGTKAIGKDEIVKVETCGSSKERTYVGGLNCLKLKPEMHLQISTRISMKMPINCYDLFKVVGRGDPLVYHLRFPIIAGTQPVPHVLILNGVFGDYQTQGELPTGLYDNGCDLLKSVAIVTCPSRLKHGERINQELIKWGGKPISKDFWKLAVGFHSAYSNFSLEDKTDFEERGNDRNLGEYDLTDLKSSKEHIRKRKEGVADQTKIKSKLSYCYYAEKIIHRRNIAIFSFQTSSTAQKHSVFLLSAIFKEC